MPDLLIAAGAALLFAVWLRLEFYVLIHDGLMIAAGLFFAYILVAAQVRG
ncbi:hypothetical protein GCM10010400_77310 [Streptomyces aculeolatus]|nr:hypothetical protein [Streptomyces aculeolatus]